MRFLWKKSKNFMAGDGLSRARSEVEYTIGLSNFHAYKPEYIQQEIWAKLIAYNITETLINHTVIKRRKQSINIK